MIDYFQYIAFRVSVFLFNSIPYRIRVRLAIILVRFTIRMRPKYKGIAHKNLELVFPDATEAWRESILQKHIDHLGYVLVDTLELHRVTKPWTEEHVEIGMTNRVRALAESNTAVISVSGHLGNFEWMPSLMAHLGTPVHYIVRTFKQPLIDSCWNQTRETHGSRVIPRNQGMRGILSALKAGKSIGLLFDQNLRRSHAIFVPWFNRKAATTRALAISVCRFDCPVLVGGLFRTGDRQYAFEITELNFSSMVASDEFSKEEKEQYITRRCVEVFEEFILKAPEQWFWFHRRWKTTPHEGISEDFYDDV